MAVGSCGFLPRWWQLRDFCAATTRRKEGVLEERGGPVVGGSDDGRLRQGIVKERFTEASTNEIHDVSSAAEGSYGDGSESSEKGMGMDRSIRNRSWKKTAPNSEM
ncbi:hypothetical protein PIB30_033964 [Stylosanthes scabra]|uniref:Uncharacterized protein n=1 Tax=Stylosanthes scabra TaxID=79078 RepID=A0ABU6RDA3_9FABA|nr:hypothetical protein [Stylosanthes scabra]